MKTRRAVAISTSIGALLGFLYVTTQVLISAANHHWSLATLDHEAVGWIILGLCVFTAGGGALGFAVTLPYVIYRLWMNLD